MSVARNASATTSLPNPAALTPAGTGRSNVDSEPPLAGRAFSLSLLLLYTGFGWSSTAPPAGRGPPTRFRRPCPTLIRLANLPACCVCVASSLSAGAPSRPRPALCRHRCPEIGESIRQQLPRLTHAQGAPAQLSSAVQAHRLSFGLCTTMHRSVA